VEDTVDGPADERDVLQIDSGFRLVEQHQLGILGVQLYRQGRAVLIPESQSSS
jgi:hypothetical protein